MSKSGGIKSPDIKNINLVFETALTKFQTPSIPTELHEPIKKACLAGMGYRRIHSVCKQLGYDVSPYQIERFLCKIRKNTKKG